MEAQAQGTKKAKVIDVLHLAFSCTAAIGNTPDSTIAAWRHLWLSQSRLSVGVLLDHYRQTAEKDTHAQSINKWQSAGFVHDLSLCKHLVVQSC